MLVHNPVGLWEITVEQSSPLIMFHIVIIRNKTFFPVNRRLSVHPPNQSPLWVRVRVSPLRLETLATRHCALLHCFSGTFKPRLQKGKRLKMSLHRSDFSQIEYFPWECYPHLSWYCLQLCKVFHCIMGKYRGSRFIEAFDVCAS